MLFADEEEFTLVLTLGLANSSSRPIDSVFRGVEEGLTLVTV